jgi:hypothetical protein
MLPGSVDAKEDSLMLASPESVRENRAAHRRHRC